MSWQDQCQTGSAGQRYKSRTSYTNYYMEYIYVNTTRGNEQELSNEKNRGRTIKERFVWFR